MFDPHFQKNRVKKLGVMFPDFALENMLLGVEINTILLCCANDKGVYYFVLSGISVIRHCTVVK